MKNTIIEYLKTDRSFNAGVSLYMIHGNNQGLKATLNRQGETDYNKRLLLEELRKIAGIDELHYSSILATPVQAPQKVIIELPVTVEEKQVFITELPEEIRKTIRLRDEFPFLNAKDCPDEFKILVSDMISAYARYVDGHKRLFDALTEDELSTISQNVVEDYLENRLIWKELEFYKKEGKPLGEHPIWASQARILEIEAMSTPDLVKLQGNLRGNISKNKKWLAGNPEGDKAASWAKKIEDYGFDLTIVQATLGKR